MVAVNGNGWKTSPEAVAVHPNASVTVTLYTPAGKLLAVGAFCWLASFHA
jgi:hypothetical protein